MLIALMTILFLGGGGDSAALSYIADSLDAVKAIVVDDDRRDEAVGTLESLQDLGKQQTKAKQDALKQLKKALAAHESSTHASDGIWREYYDQVREINDEAVELRFRLRDHLTRDEWEQVFPMQRNSEQQK